MNTTQHTEPAYFSTVISIKPTNVPREVFVGLKAATPVVRGALHEIIQDIYSLDTTYINHLIGTTISSFVQNPDEVVMWVPYVDAFVLSELVRHPDAESHIKHHIQRAGVPVAEVDNAIKALLEYLELVMIEYI